MNIKKLLISLAVLLVAFVAIAYFWPRAAAPGGEVTCTMEAKICPDGSAVGRTGPNCEFAACPVATSTPPAPTSATLHAAIGQKVIGTGVSLTPLEIMSDSRCPTDVQCVWAGTVEVKVRIESGLGTSDMTIALGKSVTTEGETITFTDVGPAKSSGTTIPTSSYQFTFEVAKQ